MYICPICKGKFEDEDVLVKHLTACWKKTNPTSKDAPHSAPVESITISKSVEDFFSSLRKE